MLYKHEDNDEEMTTVTDIKTKMMEALTTMLENCDERYDAGEDSFAQGRTVEMSQEMAKKVMPWVSRAMARIEKELMDRVDEWVIDTEAEIKEDGIYIGIEGRQKLWKTYLFDDIESLLEDAFDGVQEDDEESDTDA